MCIVSSPKAIAAPTVAPAPTRASVAANSNTLITQNAALVQKRQGVFGSIRTTPLGDASYGGAAVAKFG